jgi:hypothetical protein
MGEERRNTKAAAGAATVAGPGLMATAALEETAAAGWFNIPGGWQRPRQPGNKASRRHDHL